MQSQQKALLGGRIHILITTFGLTYAQAAAHEGVTYNTARKRHLRYLDQMAPQQVERRLGCSRESSTPEEFWAREGGGDFSHIPTKQGMLGKAPYYVNRGRDVVYYQFCGRAYFRDRCGSHDDYVLSEHVHRWIENE